MWNNKLKAVTFSIDDGCASDKRIVEIFNKYGIKGTFNINSGLLNTELKLYNNEGNVVEVREIYRDLKVHGTKAELVGVVEENSIDIRYFGGEKEHITVDISAANVGGHMGGDYFMMDSLYRALNGEAADGIIYLDVSIESHLMSFAAEESRLHNGAAYPIKK